MKKYTYLFEIFGKKNKFICEAISRIEADKLFKEMLFRNTNFDSVIEDNIPKIKEHYKSYNDAFQNFDDIFSSTFGNFFNKK